MRALLRDTIGDYPLKYRLKTLYGLSKTEFAALKAHQEGHCAICGVFAGNALSVDHDHFSKEVRGLLCWSCNIGLGHFRDNPDTLTKAIAYLNRTIAPHEES